MKYLVLCLLVLGCTGGVTEPSAEELLRQEEIAQGYVGKCFLDMWERNSLLMIEDSNKAGITTKLRTGVSLCYMVKQCDFEEKNKCVTTKVCSKWARNDYFLDTVLKHLKPTECP